MWAMMAMVAVVVGCSSNKLVDLRSDRIRVTTVSVDTLKTWVQFDGVAGAIGKALDRPVDIRSDWDVESIRVHMADKHIKDAYHLMYLTPEQYCRVAEQFELSPLAVRKNLRNESTETGLIVVKKGSAIKTLADIQGKKFAFGPHGSTYQFYNVLELLGENKVPVAMLGQHRYAADSLAVVQAVLMGAADAGVVTQTWWQTTNDRSLSLTTKLKDELEIIAETKPWPETLWVATASLNQADRATVTDVLTKGIEGKAGTLGAFGATGFVAPDDEVKNLTARMAAIKNIPPAPKFLDKL
jgi:ABC-type phosphate/phosphonate transport system substrate-binding protein